MFSNQKNLTEHISESWPIANTILLTSNIRRDIYLPTLSIFLFNV